MLNPNMAITEFKSILLHNLGLHERHEYKTDTFESEEIDVLYKAFLNYERNVTKENLTALSAALKQCESINKDLPYEDLYALVEKMKSGSKRNTP